MNERSAVRAARATGMKTDSRFDSTHFPIPVVESMNRRYVTIQVIQWKVDVHQSLRWLVVEELHHREGAQHVTNQQEQEQPQCRDAARFRALASSGGWRVVAHGVEVKLNPPFWKLQSSGLFEERDFPDGSKIPSEGLCHGRAMLVEPGDWRVNGVESGLLNVSGFVELHRRACAQDIENEQTQYEPGSDDIARGVTGVDRLCVIWAVHRGAVVLTCPDNASESEKYRIEKSRTSRHD